MVQSTVSSGFLSDQAYVRLRDRILNLSLLPGQTISEPSVSKELSIGKTPVREALKRLTQEGYLTARPKVGYVVTPVTISDVRELIEVRLLLEPSAIAMAVPTVDISILRGLDAEAQELHQSGDIGGFVNRNQAFHVFLVGAAGNARLTSLIEANLFESQRLYNIALKFEKNTVHEHSALLQAIESRDAERAAAISTDAITSLRESIMESVLTFSNLGSLPIIPDSDVARTTPAQK